jgi:hypothetical protein
LEEAEGVGDVVEEKEKGLKEVEGEEEEEKVEEIGAEKGEEEKELVDPNVLKVGAVDSVGLETVGCDAICDEIGEDDEDGVGKLANDLVGYENGVDIVSVAVVPSIFKTKFSTGLRPCSLAFALACSSHTVHHCKCNLLFVFSLLFSLKSLRAGHLIEETLLFFLSFSFPALRQRI